MANLKVAGLDIGSHNLTIDESSGTLLVDGKKVSGSGGGGISYVWANETARTATTGMKTDEQGLQQDTGIVYKYNGTAWKEYYVMSDSTVQKYYEGTSAPVNSKIGDEWFDQNDGTLYKRVSDGTDSVWMAMNSSSGGGGGGGIDDKTLGKLLKTINGNSLIGTGNILLRNSDYVDTKRKGKNVLYLNGVLNKTNASVLVQGITPQNDDEIIFSDGNVEKSIVLKDKAKENEDGYYKYVQSDPEVQDIFGDGSCTHVFGFNNTLKSTDEKFEFKKLNGTSVVGEYVKGLNNTALLPFNLGSLEAKGLRPSLENLSISLWVKPIKLPSANGVILTIAGFDIIFETIGKFGIVYSGSSKRCSKSINLNEWYLITIVSPTNNPANIKMYINEELQAPVHFNNWNTAVRDLTLSFASGYGDSLNNYSHIDTLRLFNRALTIEEISSLYNNNGAITTEVRHNMGVIPTIANKLNVVKNINLLTYPNDDMAKADGLVSGDMYVDNNGFVKLVI